MKVKIQSLGFSRSGDNATSTLFSRVEDLNISSYLRIGDCKAGNTGRLGDWINVFAQTIFKDTTILTQSGLTPGALDMVQR